MKSSLLIALAALTLSSSAFAGTARQLDLEEKDIAQAELTKSSGILAQVTTCIITTTLYVECDLAADGVGAEHALFNNVVLKDGKITSLKFMSF